jgi:hypothetical protein
VIAAWTPDPFAEPVTFTSGVRWEPTDYKPLTPEARAEYIRFAAKPEGRPRP